MPINPIPEVVTDYQIFISNDAIIFNSSDAAIIMFPPEVTLLNYTQTSRMLGSSSSNAGSELPNRCTSIFEPYNKITCSMIGPNQLQVNGIFGSSI